MRIKSLDPFPGNNIGFYFPNNCSVVNLPAHGGWNASPEGSEQDVLFTLVRALIGYCGDDVRTLNVRTDTKRYFDNFIGKHKSSGQ